MLPFSFASSSMLRFALAVLTRSLPLLADTVDSYEDRYIACGIESVMEMDAVRDFALLRGLVYPRAAYSEMRMFASEVHHSEIDELVEQAHKTCEGVTMADGSPVGPRVGRGVFEASLLGSFLW